MSSVNPTALDTVRIYRIRASFSGSWTVMVLLRHRNLKKLLKSLHIHSLDIRALDPHMAKKPDPKNCNLAFLNQNKIIIHSSNRQIESLLGLERYYK